MRVATSYGACHIDPMPGQPQIAICHSFFIHANLRGKGYAHSLKVEQMQALRANGFDYAICTVAGDNLAQQAVLKNAGWTQLPDFYNRRTDGKTQLWGTPVISNVVQLGAAAA